VGWLYPWSVGEPKELPRALCVAAVDALAEANIATSAADTWRSRLATW
jgi:hypothetical protein